MKKRRGISLLEVVLYMMIASIMLVAIGGVIFAMSDHFHVSSGEFMIQSDIRHTMQVVSTEVKKSTVAFVVTSADYDGDPAHLTPKWNYIGLNSAGTAVVNYVYDEVSGTHKEIVLSQSEYGVKYKLTFEKDSVKEKRVITVSLEGELTVLDKGGPFEYALSTSAEATNAINIFTRESAANPGVAIAYRTDPIPKGVRIRIGFVFDNSGSMRRDMNGQKTSISGLPSRLDILQDKSKELVKNLAEIGVVDATLASFGSRLKNGPLEMYDLTNELTDIEDKIDEMKAWGATNMGDGFRYAAAEISDAPVDPEIQYKNYYVLLTDGALNGHTRVNATNNYAMARETPTYVIGGQAYDYVKTLYNHYRSTSGIDKVYVIGFSGISTDIDGANQIAIDCGGAVDPVTLQPKNYYEATSADDLDAVFEEIRNEIAKEVWYIMGP